MNYENEMMTFSAEKLSINLNQLMINNKVDGVRLSKHTGVPTTTINRLRKADPNNNPTLTTLVPIANFFSVTVSQLIGEEVIIPSLSSKLQWTALPILSWNEATIPSDFVSDQSKLTILSENEYSKESFALILDEEEIEGISKGSILLFDPKLEPKSGDIVLVYRFGQNKPVLKKFIVENSTILLKSMVFNKLICQIELHDKVLAVLVEFKKFLRKQ